MLNHYKQRKQWAEGKANALSPTGCETCGRWGDKPEMAHASEANMAYPEREPFVVTDDNDVPLSCELITSEAIQQYEFWTNMPDYAVWNHELHLGFGVADCNTGCEKTGEKPKSIGLAAAIKAKLKIEDVAERLTNLRGMGNRLKGKCPLHGEETGEAFSIWTDTQTWRCFGACATGGDVIDFIKECSERGIAWRNDDRPSKTTAPRPK